MKRITVFVVTVLLSVLSLTGCNKNGKEKASAAENKAVVVASTSWTAAFADIAGAENVKAIAPASLRHPPEYEVTVEDIQTISDSNYFIYAGFERMMKTLGDSVGNTQMVKISCTNAIETVSAETRKIAALLGTEDVCEKRLAEYVKVITDAKAKFAEDGTANLKVLCNANQIYLAKDLGLNVAATFGPGPVTSGQLSDAKDGGYDIIIDNVHNPVGATLAEVAPEAKYIIWRNFPEDLSHNALKTVVENNIKILAGE